jgi:hypothetical protein
MSSHIRIDEATHATLKEFAKKDNATIPDLVREAVETLRRQRFFAEMESAFARMTPDERADYHAEAATLAAGSDGLEDEDWKGFE